LLKGPEFFKLNATQQKFVTDYIEVMNSGQLSFRQFTE